MLKDIFSLLLYNSQRAAVLHSKLLVVGPFNRECIGTLIMDWDALDHEIGDHSQCLSAEWGF